MSLTQEQGDQLPSYGCGTPGSEPLVTVTPPIYKTADGLITIAGTCRPTATGGALNIYHVGMVNGSPQNIIDKDLGCSNGGSFSKQIQISLANGQHDGRFRYSIGEFSGNTAIRSGLWTGTFEVTPCAAANFNSTNATKRFANPEVAVETVVGGFAVPPLITSPQLSDANAVGNSEANPIYICNSDQLRNLSSLDFDAANGGANRQRFWKLGSDINLGDDNFTPIASVGSTPYFTGAIDGGNHTISGMTIAVTTSLPGSGFVVQAGLPSTTNPTVIKNLRFSNPVAIGTSGSGPTAIVIGNSWNNVTVENIAIETTSTAQPSWAMGLAPEDLSEFTPLLVGFPNLQLTLRNIFVKAGVVSTGSVVGGLIGQFNQMVDVLDQVTAATKPKVTISQIAVVGSIRAPSIAGGLVGHLDGKLLHTDSTFSQARFAGTVTAQSYLGAIFGKSAIKVFLNQTYASGSIVAQTAGAGATAVGGFMGQLGVDSDHVSGAANSFSDIKVIDFGSGSVGQVTGTNIPPPVFSNFAYVNYSGSDCSNCSASLEPAAQYLPGGTYNVFRFTSTSLKATDFKSTLTSWGWNFGANGSWVDLPNGNPLTRWEVNQQSGLWGPTSF